MSIFGSFNIGTRGLGASQLALNVTGQNISNANTEGYSRKRLELSADTRRDQEFGEMGTGVSIEKVARAEDEFLERQIRGQVTEKGFFTALDETLQRVENIFTEPSDAGLNLLMDKFWASWQDLSNNPADPASREVVRTTALVLEDKFHTVSSSLEEYRLSRDDAIEAEVNQVNGITAEIFRLNGEVAVGELQGGEANDSRDRRDTLVKKLADLIDVDTVEDNLGRITLTTAGNVLVGPSTYIELKLDRDTITAGFGEKISQVSIIFANTNKTYIPRGGALKGIMESRDKIVPEYQAKLNEIAAAFVNEVNAVHKSGYNLNENTGIAFFDEDGVRADTLMVSSAVRLDSTNISAAKGGNTIGPVTEITAIPLAATPDLDLRNINSAYRDLALGTVSLEWNGQQLEEGAGKDYVVDYEHGVVHFMNYARFAAGDPVEVTFRYNTVGFAGPGDGSNALKIASIRDDLAMGSDAIGRHNKTIGEYYAGMIGVLGIERNQAKTTVETRAFLVEQFEARKQEITGVSLDEELANMIKYEHTYQASARYITVINQLLESLLNIV